MAPLFRGLTAEVQLHNEHAKHSLTVHSDLSDFAMHGRHAGGSSEGAVACGLGPRPMKRKLPRPYCDCLSFSSMSKRKAVANASGSRHVPRR